MNRPILAALALALTAMGAAAKNPTPEDIAIIYVGILYYDAHCSPVTAKLKIANQNLIAKETNKSAIRKVRDEVDAFIGDPVPREAWCAGYKVIIRQMEATVAGT